jgi:hypothetical protein
MCPVERRPNERAMHETFLVIRATPADMGSRPLAGPFATPDLTVGPDGRPRAVIWNLGTRAVEGVQTEFIAVPAGLPVRPENGKLIGMGNPANIPANSSVAVTCMALWPRMSSADVLLVTAYHPDLDPVKAALDPMADRHVGQMNYAWAGTFEGRCGGNAGFKVRVEIRPANKGLYRVKLFQSIDGRMPSHPQVDRIMAPNGVSFRWLEVANNRRDDWEMVMVDNTRVSIRCRTRMLDGSAKDAEVSGAMERA